MAFYSKAGGVLRKSQSLAQNVQSPMASMLMGVRCITSKLYIKGISDQADDQSLRKAFSSYGDVIEAKVVCERGPLGKSRGFAFVTFNNLDSAASAMSSMDDQELLGQKIRVYYAYGRQGPRTYGGSTLFGGIDCGYNLENPKY